MAMIIKQSTGGTLKIGPFLDEDDGKTAETALTIPASAVRLTKAGGDFAAKNSGTAASHDEFGWYDVPYNGTDANTVGPLIVAIHGTGALPVWREFQVVEEDTYEFLYASGATPDTDIAAINTDTYQAKVDVIDDDAGARDYYSVLFFKNGEPVNSGITSPTIQVVDGSDGSDLVASVALTEIASQGRYIHTEGTSRMVSGEVYVAITAATIDGSSRAWQQAIGRDD